MKKLIVLILTSFLAMSCETQFIIDSRLKPYVDSFYHEASLRNIHLPKDNLIVKIKKGLINNNQNGLCIEEDKLFGDDQLIVYIDEEYYNNNQCIEGVVFHELGHALLNRKHENNTPSLMQESSLYSCFTIPGMWPGIDQRSILINELFNPHIK
ncbi:MAG TPA: hypothetical protein VFV86_10660 [Nitrososphaeraceae archaeon]|nr:hypothetical protein [Nitrososphaeraceae archaeon]